MFGEDLPDEMTPRVDGHNFSRLGPLRLRHDPSRWCCVGQVGAVVSRERPRCNRERSVDCISARIGTNRIALLRVGGARDYGPAFGRDRGAPAGRNRTSTGISGMGSEPDMPRYRMFHAAFHNGKT